MIKLERLEHALEEQFPEKLKQIREFYFKYVSSEEVKCENKENI